MSTGKYISLEEARKLGQEERFAKEHQSTGNEDAFFSILSAMAKTQESGDQTSNLKTQSIRRICS